MADTCLAAQLYTVRQHTQTSKDFAQAMKRIRAIGYQAVQLSAVGPIPPDEIRRILDGEGLVACATHVAYERLRNETDALIEEHRTLGCPYPAIGALPKAYRTAEGYGLFARECSAVAARLAEAGLTFAYHNHNFEFERFGRRTGFEILYTESDPAVCKAEPDTYWIQAGGADPAYWIRWLSARAPLIHLKDMAIRQGQQAFAEVGEGNLNWPAIFEACAVAGAVWYIVEQDTCPGDPFESLAISYRNLRAMGFR